MPNREPSAARRASADACLADLDAIAWSYVREVRELTGYLESVVAEDELFATARRTLELLFQLVRDEPLWEELREHSEAVGRRRVRLGVPLESLLRAVRMDFRFIWQALTSHAPSPAADLAGDVVAIWEAVEAHTTNVQAGYMDELASMRVELEREQAFLLRRLLDDATDDRILQRQAAEALGIPTVGPYVVAAPHPAFAPSFAEAVSRALPEATVLRLDGVDFAVVAGCPEAHERLAGLPIGLSPTVPELAGLGEMWRLARELAEWAREDRAATVASLWDRIAAQRLGTIATAFASDALHALADLPPDDRALLIEAVREHARTGSAAKAAAALYCHRNTVMNRLGRFAQLTGFDPTVPDDAGAIRLALAAWDVEHPSA